MRSRFDPVATTPMGRCSPSGILFVWAGSEKRDAQDVASPFSPITVRRRRVMGPDCVSSSGTVLQHALGIVIALGLLVVLGVAFFD